MTSLLEVIYTVLFVGLSEVQEDEDLLENHLCTEKVMYIVSTVTKIPVMMKTTPGMAIPHSRCEADVRILLATVVFSFPKIKDLNYFICMMIE